MAFSADRGVLLWLGMVVYTHRAPGGPQNILEELEDPWKREMAR